MTMAGSAARHGMAGAKAESGGGARSDRANEYDLSDKDFRTIAAIIYDDAGIVLKPLKMALVYSRLARRVRALGLAGFGDYCNLVSSDAGHPERREMLAALTTNVTNFFRENHHFEHMRDVTLPPLLEAARQGGRVRFWSAGCSNGHEPYSIAMTILSLMPDANKYDIKILASDIDPYVVAFGRAGIYDAAAVEPIPMALRKRWFVSHEGGAHYKVVAEMQNLVSFRELNLIGQWPMTGVFQAIFCRNVLIYFDEATRETVWHRFCDYLDPAGFLYVGHSERVSGAASLRLATEASTTYRLRGEAR
ncbi:protein-glutamate O-methyltransferase [Fulvimarina sp. 2208YS6-2-32]|uniref:Chemotaxis protein methyltransferase n=1 Tax=Fulvimarina uroteuthidis TaxID=3098149 RepID=A0ABU5HXB4_9HYPH|nr:protein-glutamate O-methyltransferase [Fulvimarina sp. 2208YS6-2-32]MDY8107779.1 protein-glutamate O-methyltransferase [Fulvimarina sp. 2208YS6-2-32]